MTTPLLSSNTSRNITVTRSSESANKKPAPRPLPSRQLGIDRIDHRWSQLLGISTYIILAEPNAPGAAQAPAVCYSVSMGLVVSGIMIMWCDCGFQIRLFELTLVNFFSAPSIIGDGSVRYV